MALSSTIYLSLFEPLFLYFRASALDTFISVFRSFLPCCMCVSVLVQPPLFFFVQIFSTCANDLLDCHIATQPDVSKEDCDEEQNISRRFPTNVYSII